MKAKECIARGIMPQVDESDLPELIRFLKGRGVKVETTCLNPRIVRGKQKVDRTKVRAMPAALLSKPILVSSDLLVIDGNHRWMAGVWRKAAAMNAYFVSLPFKEALEAIFEFPKTYYYADGTFHPITN